MSEYLELLAASLFFDALTGAVGAPIVFTVFWFFRGAP